MSNEYYQEDFQDENFAQEFSAFERANRGGVLGEFLSDVMIEGKSARSSSPEDRFMKFVNAIATELNLSFNDIRKILETIESQKINHIAYRNPTVFVLGFIASRGGSNVIYKSEVERVFEMLPKFKDLEIHPADVIRYMRFWLTLTGNLSTVSIQN